MGIIHASTLSRSLAELTQLSGYDGISASKGRAKRVTACLPDSGRSTLAALGQTATDEQAVSPICGKRCGMMAKRIVIRHKLAGSLEPLAIVDGLPDAPPPEGGGPLESGRRVS
jgi:hypothetical protein